jgi:hypothetical protein
MSAIDEITKAMEQFPTPQEFCLSVSLYKPYQVTQLVMARVQHLLKFDGHLDMYCPDCKATSVFQCTTSYDYHSPTFDNWHHSGFMTINAICSRRQEHVGSFVFRLRQDCGIQKIGQYPSAADIGGYDVKKYGKVLSKENFSGLKTAIGLSAHGVGAGALVYLRRIFESLIAQAHEVAIKESAWDEEAYLKGRMQERVKLLRNYLPPFLVEHNKLYGILSHGIHEMPEEQCREYFPILKMSIGLILDQKLLELETQKKIEEAAAFISQFDQ